MRTCLVLLAAASFAAVVDCRFASSSSPVVHRAPTIPPPAAACPPPSGVVVAGFHGDAARRGWNASESALTPAAFDRGRFGKTWESAPFDPAVFDGVSHPGRAYASPLYADGVPITGGTYRGQSLSVLFTATTAGFAYAINAFATSCDRLVPEGEVLWRASVGTPTHDLDGGVGLGVLSTPALDLSQQPPRLYVVANDLHQRWLAYALDAGSGAVLAGWPVSIDPSSVAATAPAGSPPYRAGQLQRSALALSPDGTRLYVSFAGLGWMLAIDTRAPRIASAFPTGPVQADENGGLWAPGGAAVGADGRVYAMAGNSIESGEGQPGYWGESLLAWDSSLVLRGTYTPFNYCALDHGDIELGACSATLLPDLDPSTTSTPRLIALGSKQGNVYLLDRDHLPGALDARPPCSTDSTSDRSLLPPGAQPQFRARGPLNVFGPYSETYGDTDWAKSRATPAYFRDASGASLLYVVGATKAAESSQESVPPSLARVRVVVAAGQPAYLALDAVDGEMALLNPGSPVVSSDGPDGPVVWIVDENARRMASLADPAAPSPILYAVDGTTMKVLYRSDERDLYVGGKYVTPVVAHGVVFVATDRVQAFRLGGT